MRYFVKRNSDGDIVTFGRGGVDGEEITRAEYEHLREETALRIEKEIANRPIPIPQESEAPSMFERLEALEAAVLEMALGVAE